MYICACVYIGHLLECVSSSESPFNCPQGRTLPEAMFCMIPSSRTQLDQRRLPWEFGIRNETVRLSVFLWLDPQHREVETGGSHVSHVAWGTVYPTWVLSAAHNLVQTLAEAWLVPETLLPVSLSLNSFLSGLSEL